MDKIAKQEKAADRQKTNFEMFCSEHGALILTEHFDIKAPRLKYGKSELLLIRSQDTRSERASIALRLEYTNSDEGFQSTSIGILDSDELASLAEAIKYLIEHRERIILNAKTYTEVKYTSRGGFVVGMYIAHDRSVGEFMVIDRESVFLRSMIDLRDCVDEALFKIETFRNPSD